MTQFLSPLMELSPANPGPPPCAARQRRLICGWWTGNPGPAAT